MSATPPRVIAALVVTLPMMALSGGQTNDVTPRTNRATPTQTMLLRLESFAPSSRAVSFWAAPSSVWARVSSRSVTKTVGASERGSVGACGTEWEEWDGMGLMFAVSNEDCSIRESLGMVYVRVLMVSWDW